MKKTENMFGFGGSFVGTVEKIFDIMALGFLWPSGHYHRCIYYGTVLCDGKISKK